MTDAAGRENTTVTSKCIVVSCANTRYHVVRAAVASLGWHVEDGECDDVPSLFHGVSLRNGTKQLDEVISSLGVTYKRAVSPQIFWLDKSIVPSRVAALSCFHRVNHFPRMDVIARKVTLFKRLMRIRRRSDLTAGLAYSLNAFAWSFTPSTELLQLERFIAAGHEGAFFILKPNKGCEGKGIVITAEPLLVLEQMMNEEKSDEYLVQLYVPRPLCIDGKKFDLRIYVLVTSVIAGEPPRKGFCRVPPGREAKVGTPTALDGLHLFVHSEGLVRICAQNYAAPTEANCRKHKMHLTNYAVNKGSEGYTIEDVSNADDGGGASAGVSKGNKRDFTFLEWYVNNLPESKCQTAGCITGGEEGISRWERVLRRIDRCILLTVISGLEVLRREFIGTGASRGYRSDGRNCFELLGVDVLLTEDLEPVLMEVNHSPSLFCESDFDFRIKHRVLRDVFRTLEPYIPSLEDCNDASYATFQETAASVDVASFTEFRQISPFRTGGTNWSSEEVMLFEEMWRHAKNLR